SDLLRQTRQPARDRPGPAPPLHGHPVRQLYRRDPGGPHDSAHDAPDHAGGVVRDLCALVHRGGLHLLFARRQRGHFVPHRQPLLPAGSPCAAGPVLPATDWGIAHIAEYDDRRARVTPRGAGGGIALNRLRGAVTVVTYPGWQWTLSGGW